MTELKSLLDLCLRRLCCLFSQQSFHFHFPDARQHNEPCALVQALFVTHMGYSRMAPFLSDSSHIPADAFLRLKFQRQKADFSVLGYKDRKTVMKMD